MEIIPVTWNPQRGWQCDDDADRAQAVIYFASPSVLAAQNIYGALRALFPAAHIIGCSTGGEIAGPEVNDDSVSAVALRFASSRVELASVRLAEFPDSRAAGVALARSLPAEGLRAIFVLADGMLTNGTLLVYGLRDVLPQDVLLTGGLAGDGANFLHAFVGADAPAAEGIAAVIGLYGERLVLGWGSYGGWETFGPERIVTRSEGNTLYELDGEPALDLYKRYLGNEAANLPGSGLLFPLAVRRPGDDANTLVRTLIGFSEEQKTLVFAGDVPQGSQAQLMRGSFPALVEGAAHAGGQAARPGGPALALLVSCIGRKLMMGQRTADEVEAVADVLGPGVTQIGFYSYGEIAPHQASGRCELHNQTMTITTISEA
jgi:hypothetical protein